MDITFVHLVHRFIIYALMTGLARQVVDGVRARIEAKVIEEMTKPPPPGIVVPPQALPPGAEYPGPFPTGGQAQQAFD